MASNAAPNRQATARHRAGVCAPCSRPRRDRRRRVTPVQAPAGASPAAAAQQHALGGAAVKGAEMEHNEPAAANSRLEVLHLAKAYGSRKVVKDVSLTVQKGEVVGLLGPNGAGKTTSFYMIVGLVRSDAGDIRIDGQSVAHMPIHRRSRLGHVVSAAGGVDLSQAQRARERARRVWSCSTTPRANHSAMR
jgi:ABC-type glutathione transport system ATPase component